MWMPAANLFCLFTNSCYVDSAVLKGNVVVKNCVGRISKRGGTLRVILVQILKIAHTNGQ